MSEPANMKRIHEEVGKTLKTCCQELKAWRNTGTLENGTIRRIAKEHAADQLSLVEYAITEASIEHIIQTLP
jgi:uncharacterized protein Yka (UPF0111/DUF47 family)